MERAVQLSLQFGADLSVVYAVQPQNVPPQPVYDRLPADEIKMEVARHLMTVPGAASLSPIVISMRGPVDEAAASYAELWKPDLIVAGVHRSDIIKDLFAVTTVERLCIACEPPLLVVRNKPFRPYASALVPVDLLDMSRASFGAALTLVSEGSVHLLHVLDLPGAAAGAALSSAGEFGEEFAALMEGAAVGRQAISTSVRGGYVMSEIIEQAHADLPDLIVMGTAGRCGVGRALIGSTAHEILEHLPSDVLLIRSS